ncbi:leucine-rich repeat protein [Perkinsela sp. CCAP 1560/4]|nr:leucine-rich repeat protein [Perkinsela sp. CCAP 1560/4]|eukprot:KNH06387.1 leucine-rich repeat protein [Perkinsela sp. CCAP 1560/4]
MRNTGLTCSSSFSKTPIVLLLCLSAIGHPILAAESRPIATSPPEAGDATNTSSPPEADDAANTSSSNYVEYTVLVEDEEQNRMEMLLEGLENVDMFRLNSPDQFYKFYFEWPGVETVASAVAAVYWGKFHLGGSIDLGFLPAGIDSVWLNDNDLQGTLDTWALPRGIEFMTIENNHFKGTISWRMLPDRMSFLNIQNNEFHGEVQIPLVPDAMQTLYIAKNLFSCIHHCQARRNLEVFGEEDYFVMKRKKNKKPQPDEKLVWESSLSIADRSMEDARPVTHSASGKRKYHRRIPDFYGGIPTMNESHSVFETMKAVADNPVQRPPIEQEDYTNTPGEGLSMHISFEAIGLFACMLVCLMLILL